MRYWITLLLFSSLSFAAVGPDRVIEGVVKGFDHDSVVLQTQIGLIRVPRRLISEKKDLRPEKWLRFKLRNEESKSIRLIRSN